MSKHSAFYNSMAWKTTSRAYRQSVGGLCERCMSKGLVNPAEVIHHKIPLTDRNISDLSISLSWDNLQALCRQCHADAHEEMYRARTKKRYTIAKDGRVIITEEQDDNQNQRINRI